MVKKFDAREFVESTFSDLKTVVREYIHNASLSDTILVYVVSASERGTYQLEDALSFFGLGNYEDGDADYDQWEQVVGRATKVEDYLNNRLSSVLGNRGTLRFGWKYPYGYGLYLTVF